nr:AIR synthase-related protein [Chloroflexota bacterium]
VLGRFRDDGRLLLTYGEQTVADLRMDFLHGGRPQRVLQARFRSPLPQAYGPGDSSDTADNAGWLLRLLAHPNIACKREIIRQYDHEVGAGTVVRPLVGHDGPADAAVLRPLLSSRSGTVNAGWRGVVVAHGINPRYGALDPHAMALLTVDEALRNLVAAGGSIDRAALLDNFCWGDVDDPEVLGTLVRAAQGCRDAAGIYRVPFISGKDSLRNCTHDASGRHSIPGTLLISAVGTIPDARRAVTMDLKRAGNSLYLLGITGAEFGGSHYLEVRGIAGGRVPRVRPEETPHLMRRLTRAIRRGLVTSCHDLSEGGLAVAAAEMAIAGRLGLEIELAAAAWPGPNYPGEALLFAESPGRFLVEVSEERASTFERLMGGVPCARLGTVCSAPRLGIQFGGAWLIDLPVSLLESRWKGVRYGRA